MQVMFLTAGTGTRLRPYTEILPKPAMPLLNIPLLCYGLELLRPLEVDRIVGNLHHLPDKMKALWESLPVPTDKLILSDEREKILGSAGGLERAREHFEDGSVLLVNGDEVFLPEDPEILARLWQHHEKRGNVATLLCIEHEGVGSQFGGVWVNDQNQVLGFGKQAPSTVSDKASKGLHYTGYMALSSKIFDFIPAGQESNILYDAVTKALSLGHRAEAYVHNGHWFETGNPNDFLTTTGSLLGMIDQSPYLQELLSYWGEPYHLTQDGKALISKTAQCPANLTVEGFAVIGPQAILAQGTQLKNSIIGPGVTLDYPQKLENELLLG